MSPNRRGMAVGGLLLVFAILLVAAAVIVLVGRPAAGQLSGANIPTDALPPIETPDPTPSSAPQASGATPAPAPPTPAPTPAPPGADPLLGTDGRLTVLLLGSDYRPAHPGNRTDAIMVVSVDPTTGKSAGFSVPRDTVDFPLPGGGTFGDKVNGMLMHFERSSPNGYAAMKDAMARAFQIEVDRYVFMGFTGVRHLVDAVGGVDVTLDRAYYDPFYWVTSRKQGWGLPAGTSRLDGDNALIFARSRKGDNDFGRARRQQILVLGALDRVRRLGPSTLPRLLEIAARTVRTDLPLDRAAELFELFSTVELDGARRVVFGPRTYATGAPGGSFALNLAVCRDWIERNFPKERPLGAWPEASPAPAAGAPSPGASEG